MHVETFKYKSLPVILLHMQTFVKRHSNGLGTDASPLNHLLLRWMREVREVSKGKR